MMQIQRAYRKDEQKTNKRRTKNEQKTKKERTKDEGRTNNERRKSVGKLVLSRRILERVRQVSSIFYAFKLTFWALNIVSW